MTPVESATSPSWMKQTVSYPPDKLLPSETMAATPDNSAEILRQLAALQQQLAKQQADIEALKRKPSTVINQQPAQAAKSTPVTPPRPPGTMLFISHEIKESPPASTVPTYTIMPGYVIPCQVETAMNSDTGDVTFTAGVTTTVYDTATGRHPLITQGSKIVGKGEGSVLLYGNELLRTVGLTLSRLGDTEPIDLGEAPLTDQAGINGLASRVDHHYWRLVGAVFIGGALKGGMQALQVSIAQAAGAGQVAAGIGSVGNQAVNRSLGRALDTRPTIEVFSGQQCNIILTKPLALTAMWQGPTPPVTLTRK
jgi:Bacterial conjugation TrbI-like protein